MEAQSCVFGDVEDNQTSTGFDELWVERMVRLVKSYCMRWESLDYGDQCDDVFVKWEDHSVSVFFGFGFGFGLENGVEVRAFRCFIGWLIIHRVSELRSRGSISFDSLWLAWSGFQTISPTVQYVSHFHRSLSLSLSRSEGWWPELGEHCRWVWEQQPVWWGLLYFAWPSLLWLTMFLNSYSLPFAHPPSHSSAAGTYT